MLDLDCISNNVVVQHEINLCENVVSPPYLLGRKGSIDVRDCVVGVGRGTSVSTNATIPQSNNILGDNINKDKKSLNDLLHEYDLMKNQYYTTFKVSTMSKDKIEMQSNKLLDVNSSIMSKADTVTFADKWYPQADGQGGPGENQSVFFVQQSNGKNKYNDNGGNDLSAHNSMRNAELSFPITTTEMPIHFNGETLMPASSERNAITSSEEIVLFTAPPIPFKVDKEDVNMNLLGAETSTEKPSWQPTITYKKVLSETFGRLLEPLARNSSESKNFLRNAVFEDLKKRLQVDKMYADQLVKDERKLMYRGYSQEGDTEYGREISVGSNSFLSRKPFNQSTSKLAVSHTVSSAPNQLSKKLLSALDSPIIHPQPDLEFSKRSSPRSLLVAGSNGSSSRRISCSLSPIPFHPTSENTNYVLDDSMQGNPYNFSSNTAVDKVAKTLLDDVLMDEFDVPGALAAEPLLSEPPFASMPAKRQRDEALQRAMQDMLKDRRELVRKRVMGMLEQKIENVEQKKKLTTRAKAEDSLFMQGDWKHGGELGSSVEISNTREYIKDADLIDAVRPVFLDELVDKVKSNNDLIAAAESILNAQSINNGKKSCEESEFASQESLFVDDGLVDFLDQPKAQTGKTPTKPHSVKEGPRLTLNKSRYFAALKTAATVAASKTCKQQQQPPLFADLVGSNDSEKKEVIRSSIESADSPLHYLLVSDLTPIQLAQLSLSIDDLLMNEQYARNLLEQREVFELKITAQLVRLTFQQDVVEPLLSVVVQSERLERADICALEKRRKVRLENLAKKSLLWTEALYKKRMALNERKNEGKSQQCQQPECRPSSLSPCRRSRIPSYRRDFSMAQDGRRRSSLMAGRGTHRNSFRYPESPVGIATVFAAVAAETASSAKGGTSRGSLGRWASITNIENAVLDRVEMDNEREEYEGGLQSLVEDIDEGRRKIYMGKICSREKSLVTLPPEGLGGSLQKSGLGGTKESTVEGLTGGRAREESSKEPFLASEQLRLHLQELTVTDEEAFTATEVAEGFQSNADYRPFCDNDEDEEFCSEDVEQGDPTDFVDANPAGNKATMFSISLQAYKLLFQQITDDSQLEHQSLIAEAEADLSAFGFSMKEQKTLKLMNPSPPQGTKISTENEGLAATIGVGAGGEETSFSTIRRLTLSHLVKAAAEQYEKLSPTEQKRMLEEDINELGRDQGRRNTLELKKSSYSKELQNNTREPPKRLTMEASISSLESDIEERRSTMYSLSGYFDAIMPETQSMNELNLKRHDSGAIEGDNSNSPFMNMGEALIMSGAFLRRCVVPLFAKMSLPMEIYSRLAMIEAHVRRNIKKAQIRHFKVLFVGQWQCEIKFIYNIEHRKRHLNRLVRWREQRDERDEFQKLLTKLTRELIILQDEEVEERQKNLAEKENIEFYEKIILAHHKQWLILQQQQIITDEENERYTFLYPLYSKESISILFILEHIERMHFCDTLSKSLEIFGKNNIQYLKSLSLVEEGRREALIIIQRFLRKSRQGFIGWRRVHRQIGDEIAHRRWVARNKLFKSTIAEARGRLKEKEIKLCGEIAFDFKSGRREIIHEEVNERKVILSDERWIISRFRFAESEAAKIIRKKERFGGEGDIEWGEKALQQKPFVEFNSSFSSLTPLLHEAADERKSPSFIERKGSGVVQLSSQVEGGDHSECLEIENKVGEGIRMRDDQFRKRYVLSVDELKGDEIKEQESFQLQMICDANLIKRKENDRLRERESFLSVLEEQKQSFLKEESLSRNEIESQRQFQGKIIFVSEWSDRCYLQVYLSFLQNISIPYYAILVPLVYEWWQLIHFDVCLQLYIKILSNMVQAVELKERNILESGFLARSYIFDCLIPTDVKDIQSQQKHKERSIVTLQLWLRALLSRSNAVLLEVKTIARYKSDSQKRNDEQRLYLGGVKDELAYEIQCYQKKEFRTLFQVGINEILEKEKNERVEIEQEEIFVMKFSVRDHFAAIPRILNSMLARLYQHEAYWRAKIATDWREVFLKVFYPKKVNFKYDIMIRPIQRAWRCHQAREKFFWQRTAKNAYLKLMEEEHQKQQLLHDYEFEILEVKVPSLHSKLFHQYLAQSVPLLLWEYYLASLMGLLSEENNEFLNIFNRKAIHMRYCVIEKKEMDKFRWITTTVWNQTLAFLELEQLEQLDRNAIVKEYQMFVERRLTVMK